MALIRVPQNTTALDMAFNLSGSLTGFPAVLAQLPVGERIGFEKLPNVWQDVSDVGQSWTPDIQGMVLDLTVPTYNERAVAKAPFTTDLFGLGFVIAQGERMLEAWFTRQLPLTLVDRGFNFKGKTVTIKNTSKPILWLYDPDEEEYPYRLDNVDGDLLFFLYNRETPTGHPTVETEIPRTVVFFDGYQWAVTTHTFDVDYDLIADFNNLPTGSPIMWGFNDAYVNIDD